MTILQEKHIQELKDHRDTKNQSEMYQRRKSKQPVELPVGIQVTELKISHHNNRLESKINPTLDDYINVKHKSLFERLKGLFT
jgi:hypothetical protein|tara:strand:- start:135 stop:383 length:249 start_codon:yes stop_codon:yes gene_type:complete